jgi:hypothetical protein
MMTGILFGVPQPPDSWEVAALFGVAGLLAVASGVLYLALRPGKDRRAD